MGWCWDGASTTPSKADLANEKDSRLDAFGNAENQGGLLGIHEEDDIMTHGQDEMIHDLEQSNARRPFPCPDVQPESPFGRLIATITSELDSTNPQRCPKDRGRQPRAQHHRGDFAPSEALSTKKVPHCFDHEPLLVSSVPSKQEQVEELRKLFCVLNQEWMRTMTLSTEIQLQCHPLNLFERAVRTLRQFICGIFAQTFEDIFAVVHLAFAAALVLHWQQDFYPWKALYDDALEWQHAISSDEDKILFLDAMNHWWRSELEYTPLLHSITPQGSLDCGDKETLSTILRSGEVSKVCIEFLDSKSI